jgi:uncharacterized membrane protein
MDKKTLALVSYIFTPIGWLISYFSYKGQEKDSFVAYHLKQSFGLFITWLVIWVAMWILMAILAMISLRLAVAVSWIYTLISLGFLVLMIIGIINANSGEEKPLPIIGKMFEGKFNFIQ